MREEINNELDKYIFSCSTCFGVIVGLYFWHLLRNQRTQKFQLIENRKELEQLRKMREISLTEPLAKGASYNLLDIVGQEDGIKSLKAALCGRIRNM